jgi:hypothetical protein
MQFACPSVLALVQTQPDGHGTPSQEIAQLPLVKQFCPLGQVHSTAWPQLLFLAVGQAAPAQVTAAGSGTHGCAAGCAAAMQRPP